MNEFQLKIVSPDGVEFNGTAESISLKSDSGYLEILAGHADYFASLGTGVARIISFGERKIASTSGGFISVKGNEVLVVTTTFEFKEDIDLARAISAKEKAETTLQTESDDKILMIAKAKLSRALNRINVKDLK